MIITDTKLSVIEFCHTVVQCMQDLMNEGLICFEAKNIKLLQIEDLQYSVFKVIYTMYNKS